MDAGPGAWKLVALRTWFKPRAGHKSVPKRAARLRGLFERIRKGGLRGDTSKIKDATFIIQMLTPTYASDRKSKVSAQVWNLLDHATENVSLVRASLSVCYSRFPQARQIFICILLPPRRQPESAWVISRMPDKLHKIYHIYSGCQGITWTADRSSVLEDCLGLYRVTISSIVWWLTCCRNTLATKSLNRVAAHKYIEIYQHAIFSTAGKWLLIQKP